VDTVHTFSSREQEEQKKQSGQEGRH